MKLKNKKTGEIIELLAKPSFVKRNDDYLQSEVNTFNSLAELNEEWEDYEEPKKYWFMDYGGRIKAINDANDEEDVARKEIGNYFGTKEEAEKVVEKLKAWKRLKDNGFRFEVWDYEGFGMKEDAGRISFEINKDCNEDKDLDLLFGGEE